jgi:DNA polymerase III subunit epsilon
MYLFFDTETAGLPRDGNAPATDVDNWPRLVQLGWVACDADGQETAAREALIKPQGFVIAAAASQVHGITTAQALQDGVALRPVLAEFVAAVQAAAVLVGHNISFDVQVLHAELIRAGLPNVFAGKRRHCTMKETADFCRLPGPRGYKWPTLTELYTKLFREPFRGAHGALADTRACTECFFKLRELAVFRD